MITYRPASSSGPNQRSKRFAGQPRIAAYVFFLGLLLQAGVGLAATQQGQPSPGAAPLSDETQKALADAAARELKNFGGKTSIPGAIVGVWEPGKALFVRAIGAAQLSPHQAMQLGDKVRVGSNTKTFLVTVILQLVDAGKMSLDDPLSKFDIGVKVPNAEHITVRQMCQMQSGLYEVYQAKELAAMHITPQTRFTPQQLIAIAVKYPPLFAPGKGWNYSNTNYLLLGLIVEAVTHRRVNEEIRARLIDPLHLTHTSFPVNDAGMPAPYAHGYTLDSQGAWKDDTVVLPPSLTWAAGVMISNMEDMKRWVKLYTTGSTNKPTTQRERLHCVPTTIPGADFGLGVGCTRGWFGYTGGINGYNTAAYYLPGKDATIIAFITSQVEKPAPGVANAILRDFTRILFPKNIAFPGPEPGPGQGK
jgi:D-alanyl-D-alanine carboxypeptidase